MSSQWKPPVMVDVVELIVDNNLESPESYQRYNRAAFAAWDWGQYDPIRVCRRRNAERNTVENHVVDGGRRTWNAFQLGIAQLPAFVEDSTGAVYEANKFLTIATNKRNISAVDRLRAAIVAGEPHAVAIQQVLAKHGLKLGAGNSWPSVNAAWYLQQVKPQALNFAFGVIDHVWHGDSEALRGIVFGGLGVMYDNHKGQLLRLNKFIDRLKVMSPLQIIRDVKGLGGQSQLARSAAVFEKIYNKRNKRQPEPAEAGESSNQFAHTA